jgi:hypothetical protein
MHEFSEIPAATEMPSRGERVQQHFAGEDALEEQCEEMRCNPILLVVAQGCLIPGP